MATTKTRNEQQDIEAVANIIANQPWPYTRKEIEALNAEKGWTFEIRYEPTANNYVSDRDCTRVEGLTLSDEHLAEAIALAKEWEN